jgi:uncharacterized protein YggE
MKTINLKKISSLLVLGLLATIFALPAIAQVTVRVTGEAVKSVDADMAVIRFGIVQQAKTPAAASQAVMAAADKTINSLVALGIEKKLMNTGYFGIYPVYDDRPNKQNDIVGYRADTTLTITVKEVSLVGQAVEASLGAGVTEVRGVNYGKKDEETLKNEVLRLAVANALRKAEVIAGALGRKLGSALTVDEQGYSMNAPETRLYMAKAMGAGAPDAFAPGSIEVRASVSILFSME